MNRKPRPGFHKTPRWLFQACNLSADERYLLMYFDSYNQENWQFHIDVVLDDIGWGEGKYYKVRGSLVTKGYLKTEKIRATDPETGKMVVIGFRATTFLTIENHGLENTSNYRKSRPSKSTQLRGTTKKGRSEEILIDEDDRF